jgi:LysM repeat protein
MDEAMMRMRKLFQSLAVCILLLLNGTPVVQAQYETPTTIPVPSPYELIKRVNWLRNGNGYAALVIDPILMGSAQAVAEGWAYNQYLDHSGGTREKLIAAGYGAGDVPWGTENIVSGPNLTIDQVLSSAWNDPLHSIPWVNPNYRHIGAAIVENDGEIFYVLHAGYTSNGIYKPQTFSTPDPNATPDPRGTSTAAAISQVIVAVVTSAPNAEGRVVHVVRPGQSLWSIAEAYGVRMADLATINGLYGDNPTLYVGQQLLVKMVIPGLSPTDTPAPPATPVQTAFASTPIPVLEGLPAATMTPTAAMISKEESEKQQRWLLFGILAAFGIGLLLVTLGSFGNRS